MAGGLVGGRGAWVSDTILPSEGEVRRDRGYERELSDSLPYGSRYSSRGVVCFRKGLSGYSLLPCRYYQLEAYCTRRLIS